MLLFLTSSPCEPTDPAKPEGPAKFSEKNGFAARLRSVWKGEVRCLVIASSPEDPVFTDRVLEDLKSIIQASDLAAACVDSWDARTPVLSAEELQTYDVIILSGGHVPTQNAFFQRIGLREKIRDYSGVVIGISAGTMNCADTVYAQPELEGESVDPSYQRFLPGLGLTELQILPHVNQVRNYLLDGKRLYEDITFPDSAGRCFYVLPDGSYFTVCDGETELFGEAWTLRDGKMEVLQSGVL